MNENNVTILNGDFEKVDVDELVRRLDEKIAELDALEYKRNAVKVYDESGQLVDGITEQKINEFRQYLIEYDAKKEEARAKAKAETKKRANDSMGMLFGGSMETSVSYDMSEEQLNSKVWGEMSEGNLSLGDMMLLTNLCNNASESRISYLVHLYNDRSEALESIEAHFVARYATRRGYTMFTDENGQTKFEKAPEAEVDAEVKELVGAKKELKLLVNKKQKNQQEGLIRKLLPSWLRSKK